MSVRISALVWSHSRHKSGERLVLLAIADHADDEGFAFPGICLLARKTRLSPRHVRRCIQALITSGELETCSKGGRDGYEIQTGYTAPSEDRSPPSEHGSSMSNPEDAGDLAYRNEPSHKTSVEPRGLISSYVRRSDCRKRSMSPSTPTGLISNKKNGF